MTRIAIIAALPGELKPFLVQNGKEGWAHERRGNVHLWRLTWPDNQGEWIGACAGMGQEAATRAFAEVEKDGAVDRVISTGWAGALSEEIQVGKAYRAGGVIDLRTGERLWPRVRRPRTRGWSQVPVSLERQTSGGSPRTTGLVSWTWKPQRLLAWLPCEGFPSGAPRA
jgi:hypothetical protein